MVRGRPDGEGIIIEQIDDIGTDQGCKEHNFDSDDHDGDQDDVTNSGSIYLIHNNLREEGYFFISFCGGFSG